MGYTKLLSHLKRGYKIESDIWGQLLDIGPDGNEMISIIASDFDSGQTVRINLRHNQVEDIANALFAAREDGLAASKANEERKKRKEQEAAALKLDAHNARRLEKLAKHKEKE